MPDKSLLLCMKNQLVVFRDPLSGRCASWWCKRKQGKENRRSDQRVDRKSLVLFWVNGILVRRDARQSAYRKDKDHIRRVIWIVTNFKCSAANILLLSCHLILLLFAINPLDYILICSLFLLYLHTQFRNFPKRNSDTQTHTDAHTQAQTYTYTHILTAAFRTRSAPNK